MPAYFEKTENGQVPIKCDYCEILAMKSYSNVRINKNHKHYFCSRNCANKFRSKKQQISCKRCNKCFFKHLCEIIGSPNHFCSRSCAVTYNNTHKTKGTRVSKLEKWLQLKLTGLYSTLEIHYNHKDAINSELDIYIPSLKLAFELNGVFHYEPIYGQDKLDQIQNNDHRKFAACNEAGISLCVIDTSKLKYFKEQNCLPYLDIIKNIIDQKVP